MLIGRHQELAEIISFASGAEEYRWLVGDAWAGKTSLLAEAVTALPGEVDVVAYFLSRREGDADSAGFLAAAVEQLAYMLGEDPPAAGLRQFRDQWQRAAERAAADDRHVLLVVDGLDEDLRPPGLPSVAAVLPLAVGGRMHVLVSSRRYPELPGDMPLGHPVDRARVELQPFEGAQERAALARQEILDLVRDSGLATDVLGLLTAAAGPLAVQDLTAMTELRPQSAALRRQIRRIVTFESARSLQPVGPADASRYQFAHASLLEYAQTNEDLNDPEFRRRIHQWAQTWRDANWPLPAADGGGTPRYLLDTYPSTLTGEMPQLAALAGDIGWVNTAIQSVGVDRALTDLRRAAATASAYPRVAATFVAVAGQAQYLRSSRLLDQPGYVLRQLCLRAAELSEDDLADDLRTRLQSQPGLGLVPQWTTRRASESGDAMDEVHALAVLPDGRVVIGVDGGDVSIWDPAIPGAEINVLGKHHDDVWAVAVLPDGRVVSGGGDERLLLWDPATPAAGPVELGHHHATVEAVAVLPDGRVVSGGGERLLLWDPATPTAGPVELGRHDHVRAMTVLPDGRVVSGGGDERLLLWDPATPAAGPLELGRHDHVRAVAVLPDGRTVGSVRYRGEVQVEGVSAVAVLPDGRVFRAVLSEHLEEGWRRPA